MERNGLGLLFVPTGNHTHTVGWERSNAGVKVGPIGRPLKPESPVETASVDSAGKTKGAGGATVFTRDPMAMRSRLAALSSNNLALLAQRLNQTMAVPVRANGHGTPSQQLIAYVVPKPGQKINRPELRRFLRKQLPDFMVPSALVVLDDLPRTPNGKVDRRALPAPEDLRPDPATDHTAPRTPTEELILSIWSEVLGQSRIGTHDHFFDLGGHSLLATRVVSRIRQTLGIELPLRSLFGYPTVAQLARHADDIRRVKTTQTSPIEPAKRDSQLPLSFSQQRLWFLNRFESDPAAYNYSLRIDLNGRLDIPVLDRCLVQASRRHEALRTTFACSDGRPHQVIDPNTESRLSIVDLCDRPRAQASNDADEQASAIAKKAFDLERGPLFRATLFRLTETEHVLLLSMHHIVGDEWSMGVLFHELTVLYKAFSTNQPSPLEDLPVQYADFAAWQRRSLTSDALAVDWEYWKTKLQDIPTRLLLPTDRPRPALQSFRGARRCLPLTNVLSDQIRQTSRQEHVTLFMTLLAAFKTLLFRYTGREDVVVGSPIAGRNRVEIEGLFGFFVNTLVLRTRLGNNPTFRQLLAKVRETTLEGYAHQDMPFEQLVERLAPRRDPSRTPLFQVMFAVKNAQQYPLRLPGLTVTTRELDHGVAKFDLAVSVDDQSDKLDIVVEYNTDLFEPDTIDRLLDHYRTLLEAIVANPDQRIGDLPMLSDLQRQQILVQWNQTDVKYPRDGLIHHLFEQQATRRPDATAVKAEGISLTYAQLNARAGQLANRLRKAGAMPGEPVILFVDRSIDAIVAILAILKAGCGYVPIDPEYPPARVRWMLEDVTPTAVVTQPHLKALLPETQTPVLCGDLQASETDLPDFTANLDVAADPESLAYIMYTSGSTGKPKGVRVTHRNVIRLICGAQYAQLDEHQTLLQLATLSFDASTFEIWGALLTGGRLVVYPQRVASLAALGTLIQSEEVTCMWLTAAFFNTVIDQQPEILRSVQQVLTGGEALSVDHIKRATKHLPHTRLINGYGPTETTTFACTFPISGCEQQLEHSVPIGKPIANTRVYVLNRHGQPAPVGVPGELYIAGDGVAQGYHDRPELTRQKFVPDPFSNQPPARMYRTGDRVRWLPNGNLQFLGRFDHQVKIRGFRVELGEIESVLSQHDQVRHGVAMVRKNSQGDKLLVAYAVPEDGQKPTPEQLRRHLEQRLPAHMVPSVLILIQTLPLTHNGKVNRKALPAPDTARTNEKGTCTAPRNDIERKLVRIWSDVLGHNRVGIHDDYFELGGHSLQAVRLFAQIKSVFGKDLPLSTLFQRPTIARMAVLIEHEFETERWAPLVTLQPKGDKPPFFCVHGIGGEVLLFAALARQMAPDQPMFGLQAVGLNYRDQPDSNVETMAERYLEAIRTVRPKGPYALGGFSSGGFIAFEMAQRLHAAGERVAILAIFDTGPAPLRSATGLQRLRVVPHFVRTLPYWIVDDLLQTPIRTTTHRVYGKVCGWGKKIRNRLVTRAPQPQTTLPLEAMFGVRRVQNWRRRFLETQYQATLRYQPREYPGRITLFRARTPPLFTATDPDLGWASLAADGVTIQVVPGSHESMFGQPNVRELAKRVKDRLQDSQVGGLER